SGERRGGEEGRSRGAPYHLKKKRTTRIRCRAGERAPSRRVWESGKHARTPPPLARSWKQLGFSQSPSSGSRFIFFKQKTAYEIQGVTGVQTCALPICHCEDHAHAGDRVVARVGGRDRCRLR